MNVLRHCSRGMALVAMGLVWGFAGALRAEGVFGTAECFDHSDTAAMALAIEGDFLYCGAGDLFLVFDISNPLKPRRVGSVAGLGAARQLVVQNGMAYVSAREFGLWIVDATQPSQPRIRSRFDCCELATGVDVAGDVCFCGQRQNGVEFIDVSNPDEPRHIAMRKTAESQSVIYRDGWLYSGEWEAGLVTIFDAHDMSAIREVGTLELYGYGDGVWLQGDYLYAARGHNSKHRTVTGGIKTSEMEKVGVPATGGGMGHGLDIFDIRDPRAPRRMGMVDYPPFYERGLDMWTPRTSGNLLVSAQTHNGLFAVDITDKSHPKILDRWISPDAKFPRRPSDCIGSVAIGNGCVYVAVRGKGFFVLPCAQAKVETFEKGVLPQNVSYREAYPADEATWHVWRPKEIGQVRAVAVKGDLAYVACGDAGFYVVEILPEGQGWRERCKVEGPEHVYDVSRFGDRLYAAEGPAGIGVYDISSPEPREIARLPQLPNGRRFAFWVTAIDETRLFCSDRHRWFLYDISKFPDFKPMLSCRGGCPGWDKYLMDRPIGGRYMAFNNAHHGIRWYDVVAGTETFETKKNFTTLLNGLCAMDGNRAILTKGTGYTLLQPNEDDPADGSSWTFTRLPWVGGNRPVAGMPRSDGRRVVLTSRIARQASLYDFSDPARPVAKGAWSFSGNPDQAVFHRGRVVIPCGYEGLLLQRDPLLALGERYQRTRTEADRKVWYTALEAAGWDFKNRVRTAPDARGVYKLNRDSKLACVLLGKTDKAGDSWEEDLGADGKLRVSWTRKSNGGIDYTYSAPTNWEVYVSAYAGAVTRYGVKVMKATTGEHAFPQVTLPEGWRIVSGEAYSGVNVREAFLTVEKDGLGLPPPSMAVSWPGAGIRAVLGATNVSLSAASATFVPSARKPPTAFGTGFGREGALSFSVPHHIKGLQAGPHRTVPYPEREIAAMHNFLFALRDGFRFLGFDKRESKEGVITLCGFESNFPNGHQDFPAHVHIIGSGRDGTQVHHYYFKPETGRLDWDCFQDMSNVMDIWDRVWRFEPGDTTPIYNVHGDVACRVTLLPEGRGFEVALPEGTRAFRACGDRPCDAVEVWTRDTGDWRKVRTVSVRDDPVAGILETPEGIVRYDPDTGKLQK